MGLQIYHLYHIKGLEKLKHFIMHLRRRDTTAKLLDIAMSDINLKIGSKSDFLMLCYDKYNKYITHNWISDRWKYMSECKATIHYERKIRYKLPRENDEYIIDIIKKSDMEDENKTKINQVRLCMKVVSLSALEYL